MKTANDNLLKGQANLCVLAEDSQYIVTEPEIISFIKELNVDYFKFKELEEFAEDLYHEYDLEEPVSMYDLLASYIIYKRVGTYVY